MIKVQILEEWEVIHRYQILDDEEIYQISKEIFKPAINGMIKNGNPFKGFLYAGLLIEEQTDKTICSGI